MLYMSTVYSWTPRLYGLPYRQVSHPLPTPEKHTYTLRHTEGVTGSEGREGANGVGGGNGDGNGVGGGGGDVNGYGDGGVGERKSAGWERGRGRGWRPLDEHRMGGRERGQKLE